ncbi:MAG: OmpA family protein [Desulfobulbaceae bacterium]
MKKQVAILLVLLSIGLVIGCAPKIHQSLVGDRVAGLLNDGYRQKVDNFLIIFDGSSSMWEKANTTKKFYQGRDVVLGINQAIDGLKLQGGLHVIGDTRATKGTLVNDSLIYGMTGYSSADYAKAVNSVEINGLTPLSIPLVKSIDTLKNTSGRTAVIVVSDGVQVSSDRTSPGEAAGQMKAAYGDRVCIYTVLVGDDPEGQSTMQAVADAGGCGFATTERALVTAEGMNDFVRKVFLEKAEAPPPSARPVTFNLYVKFDFDKDVIRPEEEDNIDEVGSFLAMHPEIDVTLEGHTCNMGPEKYNMGLSLRRAESVKQYMVTKFNIDPARLTTVGYGYSRPLESNDTKAGREANRRVMATITHTITE